MPQRSPGNQGSHHEQRPHRKCALGATWGKIRPVKNINTVCFVHYSAKQKLCKRNGRSVLWVLMRNSSAGALTDPSAGVGTSPKRTACRPRYTRYVVSGISGVLESTAGEIGRGSKMGGRTDKLFQQARKRPHTHMNSEKVRATLAR